MVEEADRLLVGDAMTAVEAQRIKNRIRSAARRCLRVLRTNHAAAVVLLRLHDAMQSRSIWPRGAIQTLKDAVDRLPGQVFRLAGYLDDKAPCPNCGKPEAIIHLARLRTYCWDCSYWGHDPKEFAEEMRREADDLDRPKDSAQT